VLGACASIWVRALADLLDAGMVLTHPFVIGEIALGNLTRRALVLSALSNLPKAVAATDAEALKFIDAHLLAAVRLTGGAALWTRDKRLHSIAGKLGLAMARS
jgi:predicted nucleic acid-binding protein